MWQKFCSWQLIIFVIHTKSRISVMLCATWYNLHNLKNVKNTYGKVSFLVKLQAQPASKSNNPSWVFFRFINLVQIVPNRAKHLICRLHFLLQPLYSRWLKEDLSLIGKVKKRLEKATMKNKHTNKDRAMIRNRKLILDLVTFCNQQTSKSVEYAYPVCGTCNFHIYNN